MSESLLHCLGYMYETLPTCEHYRELMGTLRANTPAEEWDEYEARRKYGEYTYKQWGDVIAEIQKSM